MKTKFYQYIKIFGDRLTCNYKQVIYTNEHPPKDTQFIVYCVEREGIEEHTKLNIKGKALKTLWVGQAMWNEKNNMYDIYTTAKEHENGFVCVPELESRMLWSYNLPLNLVF